MFEEDVPDLEKPFQLSADVFFSSEIEEFSGMNKMEISLKNKNPKKPEKIQEIVLKKKEKKNGELF